MGKFYITTPIYYVNDRPHIGHAYTTIAADIVARYARSQKHDVIFLTGTDENSQKTVEAAAKTGEDVNIYTNRLAKIWQKTWEELHITNTDFIRTTEKRHIDTVKEFWRLVHASGDIYQGEYKGLYCQGHEAFVKESELIGGLCPDHKTAPEHIVEENYFFRLSKYQDKLLKFYEANPQFIVPADRFHEIKNFVSDGLEDISISRPVKAWGIPVPDDAEHVIYVWFDALINYVSAVGVDAWKKHPADIHFVGKDITRFHAVIWPAMLMSAGLPLPKQIVANGFFTINGIKISKSLGNAVDPLALIKTYGNDALRYFLFREIPFGSDGDFSEEKFLDRYNGDLANGLGNLVARITTLAEKFGTIPYSNLTHSLNDFTKNGSKDVNNALHKFQFSDALASIWKLIANADRKLNTREPWKIEDEEKRKKALGDSLIEVAIIAKLLEPFLPETTQKIREQIVFDKKTKVFRIKKGANLFPRLMK